MGLFSEMMDDSGKLKAENATLKARIEELEVALRKIRSGTEDIYFPLRAMPRETMREIANDALEAKHD